MNNKTYTLGYDSESECNGLYDENGKLIRGWQDGDDVSRVLRSVLSHFNVNLSLKEITVDGGIPSKI